MKWFDATKEPLPEPLWRRYAKFCVVGGTGMVVDMAILHLLASPSMLGWSISLSKAIAAETAIFNNFLWNDWWTFRGVAAGRNNTRLMRLLKFNLICLAGIGFSVLLLNVQVHGLRINLYLANFIAIVLVSLWNFFLNAKFGWKLPRA